MKKYGWNPQRQEQTEPRTFSYIDAIVNEIVEIGKRLSRVEETVKNLYSVPRQVSTPQQPQRPGFWERLGLVDPFCAVCGSEYYAESHEPGLCPQCRQKYSWLSVYL